MSWIELVLDKSQRNSVFTLKITYTPTRIEFIGTVMLYLLSSLSYWSFLHVHTVISHSFVKSKSMWSKINLSLDSCQKNAHTFWTTLFHLKLILTLESWNNWERRCSKNYVFQYLYAMLHPSKLVPSIWSCSNICVKKFDVYLSARAFDWQSSCIKMNSRTCN